MTDPFAPGGPDGPPKEPLSERFVDLLGTIVVVLFALLVISGFVWCIHWFWTDILR